MRRRDALLGALAVCGATACDPAGQAPAPPTGSATASQRSSAASAPPTGSTAQTGYADEDLPVAADFEAAAEKEITEANYLDKLGEIETELADPVPKTAADGGAGK